MHCGNGEKSKIGMLCSSLNYHVALAQIRKFDASATVPPRNQHTQTIQAELLLNEHSCLQA